jgi:phospholipid/cholesterol/gamma-HCH transport system substrate-binding protein
MQKRTPTSRQFVIIGAFALSCFALLLYLWLAFGGSVPLKPKGYRFSVAFPQAQQLAQQADVRISGVPVGKVINISLGKDGRAHAVIELQSRYAPMHADTRAILRQKTLLGENYIELAPGSRSAPAIPDNGQLGPGQVAPSVTLDEILRSFDARTRTAYESWMQSLAAGLGNRGRDLNDAFGNLNPFTADGQQLLSILASQHGAVQALVRNAGVVFDALTQRGQQLRGLITNAGATFAQTAASDRQLAAAFRALPTFEQRSQTALRSLDSFARNASPLLDQLRPAEQQLAPALTAVRAAAPDLQGLFQALGPLTSASRTGLPAFDRALAELDPLLGQLNPVLRNINPLLRFGGLYQRELDAFFANTVAATQAQNLPSENPSAQLHYLRTTNPLSPESLAVFSKRIGSNRTNAYTLPGAFAHLQSGLGVFDTRGCANPTPSVAGPPNAQVSQAVLDLIKQLHVANAPGQPGTVPAPPCNQQGPLSFGGSTSLYPHVTADPAH